LEEFFACPVGQSCCSALNFWAAQQRRPAGKMKIFVLQPFRGTARLHLSLRFVVAKWRVKRELSRRLPMAVESRPAAKNEK